MAAKKYKWVKIAGSASEFQWTAGDVAEVELEGKKICVARFGAPGAAAGAGASAAAAGAAGAGAGSSGADAAGAGPGVAGSARVGTVTMYGFSHVCPHAGAPMMDGYTSGECNVVCPVHSLKFNLKAGGRDVNGEGYSLKTYPIEVRADGVYAGVEESGGGFFKKWF